MSGSTVIKGDFSPEYLDWRRLRSELEKSGGDPYGVIVRLGELLESQGWESLTDKRGAPFLSFSDFVRDPDRGLGMDPNELVKLIDVQGETERRAMVTGNENLTGLFERVRGQVGAAVKGDIAPSPKRGGVGRGRELDRSNYDLNHQSADGVLARLKRDDPDLAQAVIDGKTTATAAARKAGYQTPVIRLGKVTTVAKRIREHYSPEEIQELIRALQ